MKISTLISILAKQMAQYGDLPVKIFTSENGERNISSTVKITKEPYYLGTGDGFDAPTKITLYIEEGKGK